MDSVGPEALRNDTEALKVRFRTMTRQRLLGFFRQFVRACNIVNPVNRSDFQFKEGDHSEDAGKDFAAWVVLPAAPAHASAELLKEELLDDASRYT